MTSGVWDVLDLAPTDDRRLIKQAYAERLKRTRPEDDPEKFQALRRAYEAALRGDARQPRDLRESREPSARAASRLSPADVSPIGIAPLETPPPRGSVDVGPLIEDCRGLSPAQARERLEDFVRSRLGDHLDAGWEFEDAFLRRCGIDVPDYGLVCAVIDRFAWEQRDHPFQHREAQALRPIIDRARSREEVNALLSGSAASQPTESRTILKALRGPPRPGFFHLLAASPAHCRAAQALIDRWHAHLPGMFEYELNAESVRWWEIKMWEGGLTLPRAASILAVSAVLCMVPSVGLLMLFDSGEPWAIWTAFGGGMLLTLGAVMGARRTSQWVRRRLRDGAWREPAARWRRLQQDLGLRHWLTATIALMALSSPFLTAFVGQVVAGAVILALLAWRLGLSVTLSMSFLSLPSALALHAWARSQGTHLQARYLVLFLLGLALCMALFAGLDRWTLRPRWSHRIRPQVLVGAGLLVVYGPLMVWKSLQGG